MDFDVEAVEARRETHVHEFGLCVHLQAANDALIDLEFQHEFLSGVFGVSVQGLENLVFFARVQLVSRDDRDLFFFIQDLIQLNISIAKASIFGFKIVTFPQFRAQR